ncbi:MULTISPECIES: dTDP-4-dehydrorhamnose reductase [Cellulophaga]|jgi:dTDP-4-dehydrorhamnose reductase|uniref:dTDP-4-dehydrorhamnose reductase n=1 Tax=Cellulophaga TaxID=104264 RepID=UPI000425F81D|nr:MULTISPECIES: dTDP-4-dehydrorhamnose reductase [Cellulophaga]AIY12719.1 dTDP-4-dehydrorhamnose reductase [Cellulophaga baltica NN016038]KGK30409.1 dTDP-4-dehydrorhamnose reductase [Cellulophaga sp. E6(2014)]
MISDFKILVTGANGQLGKCIQDVAKNYPQHTFHFKSSKDLDITNNSQVENLFNKEKYDYCINCAAYTAVDKAEQDQEKAFLVNADAVENLAGACKATKSTLIHISTDFIFDGLKTSPYTEKDSAKPISVYGSSKLKGEQYILEILKEHFIIRTSWVYSEYGNNFVKTMLRLGKERDEISVVNDQFGSPTHAKDLAVLILKIIDLKTEDYGIYHYSNEGAISWYDFAKKIFELNKIDIKISPIPTNEYPTPAKRPAYSVMSKSKIKKVLDIEIPNWENNILDVVISKS